MTADRRGVYLENVILEVDGCRLIQIVYQAAMEAVGRAREHLRNGAILERSREISRASELLNELALSLDHTVGGELSRNLAELYDYIQHLLQEANFKQVEPPLAEAQDLLHTLFEAWQLAESRLPTSLSSAVDVRELAPERAAVDCVG
jgi:flagellar protein FliS